MFYMNRNEIISSKYFFNGYNLYFPEIYFTFSDKGQ